MPKVSFDPKRLLIVHAHPDDESLYTGHIIADRIAKGAEVFILTLTRGERGRVKLEELKALEGNLPAMGAFRANELREALAAFGSVKHAFAGTRAYLDSGMRIGANGRPRRKKRLDEMSLAAVSTSVVAEDILKTIESFNPDAVLTYNRRGGFGHPDHRVAHEATAMAVRKFARQSSKSAPSFWVIAEPRERFDAEIGDAKTAQVKKQALEAHASQVAVGRETYSVVPGKEVRYDRPERIRRAAPNPLVHLRPVLTFFWAIPLGVLAGLAGTMLHQIRGGSADGFPLGLSVALVSITSLALAIRLLRRSRGALYLMTASFISTVYLLALEQPGGELFIPNNDLGIIWSYGSIGICALVILFPRMRPGTWRRSSRGHR